MRRITAPAIAAGVVGLMLLAAPAALAVTRTTVYDNIPSPLPGNVPSIGFEATAASEFGGQVNFSGTDRNNPIVSVVMSSWACQTGHWNSGDCGTTPGAAFSVPLTIRVYAVGAGDEPGIQIGAVTHTFSMPYRPSANYSKCTGANAGKWYQSTTATCFNGKAFTRTVSLGSLNWPDTVIIGVAYNTTHYGLQPDRRERHLLHHQRWMRLRRAERRDRRLAGLGRIAAAP